MVTPFVAFVRFARHDQALVKLRDNLSRAQQLIQTTQKIWQQYTDSIEQEKNTEKELRFKVATLTKLSHDRDRTAELTQRKLLNASNVKEYQAAQNEIERLNGESKKADEELLHILAQHEEQQVKLAEKEREYAQRQPEHIAALTHMENARDAIYKEIAQLENEIASYRGTVPIEWLEQYDPMKMRVPNPMVPAIDGVCTGCDEILLLADQHAVDRNALIRCKECFRFLYSSVLLRDGSV